MFGDEAEAYAGEHLVRGDADTERMVERFSCPDTGRRWELDYPEHDDREPGQARLRAVI
jgi:hypothetical protein